MKRIGLLLLLVVLASGSVWGEVVEITDPNLRTALEKSLGKNVGDAITKEDLEKLKELKYQGNEGSQIADLTGIEYCINLVALDLCKHQISDLSPLFGLSRLTNLRLGKNKIVDISPLQKLVRLTNIYLYVNSETSIFSCSVGIRIKNIALHYLCLFHDKYI